MADAHSAVHDKRDKAGQAAAQSTADVLARLSSATSLKAAAATSQQATPVVAAAPTTTTTTTAMSTVVKPTGSALEGEGRAGVPDKKRRNHSASKSPGASPQRGEVTTGVGGEHCCHNSANSE